MVRTCSFSCVQYYSMYLIDQTYVLYQNGYCTYFFCINVGVVLLMSQKHMFNVFLILGHCWFSIILKYYCFSGSVLESWRDIMKYVSEKQSVKFKWEKMWQCSGGVVMERRLIFFFFTFPSLLYFLLYERQWGITRI